MNRQLLIAGLLDWFARMRRCACERWQLAVARREFARLDPSTLRDLGIGSSEFLSYWAEASGRAERTRRRASPGAPLEQRRD